MTRHFFIAVLSLFSITVFSQENYNLVQRGHLTFPGKSLANIGGYVDSLGNEYALVGTSTGLSIVDVTDPDNPALRFDVDGVENFWREVKTWNGFAYVTTEGNNGGLTVIDLRELPDTVISRVYFGDGDINGDLRTIHALHIDNGFCYLYGSNIGVGGIVILDLADPWNPEFAGLFNGRYVHDGYVRGDTVWACHIYDGFFAPIDVANKANPVSLVEQETPGNFTHNSWLTDDGKFLLTTDENTSSFLASYDIQDVGNISESDRYQTAAGSGAIVHNAHILNDFAVASWYTEGVVIVDAARPHNLIEVAKNDFTSFEGDGFNGCWGVYPFLPSGNLVASDIENGLFVLTPTYQRGCYLEGSVSDSLCGTDLSGVLVTITEINVSETTGQEGIYRTGTVVPGSYTVTFSKPGYQTRTLNNVNLQNGVLTEININLFSSDLVQINGNVTTGLSNPVDNAFVAIYDVQNSFQLSTDENGNYTKCDLLEGDYSVVTGEWGFVTQCVNDIAVSGSSTNVQTLLPRGYYDDFQFNFGWTVVSTATAGTWERALPAATNFNGIPSNPGVDVDGDCNGFAFVTGNTPNATPGANDVDNGYTRLTSPLMDLTGTQNPYINFYRWFFNAGGNDTPNDSLLIRLNDGVQTITVLSIGRNDSPSQWVSQSIQVKDFIQNLGTVRFIAEAWDFDNGHLVEAGIDRFSITDSSLVSVNKIKESTQLTIFPNPSKGAATLSFSSDADHVLIADISGRTIAHLPVSTGTHTVQLPQNIGTGVYFVRLFNGTATIGTTKWLQE